MGAMVVSKILKSPHQKESFTKFKPLEEGLSDEVFKAVTEIFDQLGGASLLKKSGEVYIKPNAVDSKPYSHTRVELLKAVVLYWKEKGAGKIFLFENSTQANYTRIVFNATGYTKMCRETGAIPIYLDEEKSTELFFSRKTGKEDESGEIGESHKSGMEYELKKFEMPATVMKLINERDDHLYINIPKLKTHSMGVVTLGIKNQWGFPMQKSRGVDHNFRLHHKLADILGYIKPDITLIEGIEGTIHGHYFATALADKQVKPFKVLIGSDNVVAADIVGSALFGLKVADVPHLQNAIDKGFSHGVNIDADIELAGDIQNMEDLNILGDMPPEGHYPWDLYPQFPDDVKLVNGKELYCHEGCRNNPLCLLQNLSLDYGGRGGWTMVAGKGHDPLEIAAIEGAVLVVGPCAVSEVAEQLINRLGEKKVYISNECNNLAATAEAMFHLMKVNPATLVPISFFTALSSYTAARMKGSCSRVPHPLSHIIKRT